MTTKVKHTAYLWRIVVQQLNQAVNQNVGILFQQNGNLHVKIHNHRDVCMH